MKKFLLSLVLVSFSILAQNIQVNIEIKGIKTNSGKVFIAVYNNSEEYKKHKVFMPFIMDSKTNPLNFTIEIPKGDYVFSVYQDINNNGKLETNLIGMPKEPVGISNYNGKGIPGGFDKLKMKIDENNKKVLINVVEL